MSRKIGDVNNDGVVNTLDATFILSYLVDISGYNLPDSEPVSSIFNLVPGILYGEQNLGDGQPNALRLIDYSDNTLHDLKVSELKSRINFYINENDEIVLSCVENSTINGRDISGMGVVSMLFNVIDTSGVIDAQSDISLDFINDDISNSSIFSISGEISGKYCFDLGSTIEYDINSSNTEILFDNNIIKIKSLTNILGYIKRLNFTLVSNSTILDNDKIFLQIAPGSVYDVSYNTNSNNFDISLNKEYDFEDISENYIIYSETEYTIGFIRPYAYYIQPSTNLGSQNISYYNIYNLSYNKDNIIVLSSEDKILGKIIK